MGFAADMKGPRTAVAMLGLILGIGAILLLTRRAAPCARLVVHYHGGVNESSFAAYQDLLRSSPSCLELVGVVTTSGDGDRLRDALGDDPRLRVLTVPRPLSPWARDRYVLYSRGGRTACLAPPIASLEPHIQGDAQVPDVLRAIDPDLQVIRSELAPEGGDTLVLTNRVLVGYESIRRGARRAVTTSARVVAELGRLFDRDVFVVGSATQPLPRSHIDLFVADAGRGRLVVADAGAWSWPFPHSSVRLHSEVVFRRAAQARFAATLDALASQLRSAGFDVHRVPGLFAHEPARGGQAVTLTYTNVERVDGTVFLPRYDLPRLDARARLAWERLGYEVAPIDVRGSILNGGAVRCLTNRLPE